MRRPLDWGCPVGRQRRPTMLTKKKAVETVPVEKTGEGSVPSREPFGSWLMTPFPPMRRLFEDMERMFEDVGPGVPLPSFWRFSAPAKGVWTPPAEMLEKDGTLEVSVDLPGLTPNDVKVEIREHELVIEGERKTEHEEKGEGFYRTERTYGTFFRAMPLPENAETDKAKASFTDGVLHVVIPVPKRPEAEVRRLEIATDARKGSHAA